MRYADSVDGLGAEQLIGFFEGWPNAPSPKTHLDILRGSGRVVLCQDDSGRVVGFITAITDGILAAYIPLLEVLPSHRGRGIGTELVRRMLIALENMYMVDAVCDPDIVPFYERLGMQPHTAVIRRRSEMLI